MMLYKIYYTSIDEDDLMDYINYSEFPWGYKKHKYERDAFCILKLN